MTLSVEKVKSAQPLTSALHCLWGFLGTAPRKHEQSKTAFDCSVFARAVEHSSVSPDAFPNPTAPSLALLFTYRRY